MAALILTGSGGRFLYKQKAAERRTCGRMQVHWLCGLAAGPLTIIIFDLWTSISVSFLHFGQNTGKFFISVSARILSRVFSPQTGHLIQIVSSIFTQPTPFILSGVAFSHITNWSFAALEQKICFCDRIRLVAVH